MTADRRVVIDFLPESARAYDDTWAVVAVDILRATTTAVTIAWSGRRCLPVGSLEEAHDTAARLHRPLLVGELGGDLPEGFDLQNSPCALESLSDLERPVVLLSSSGTRIFGEAAAAAAVYAACLRNLTAQVAHLAAHHPRVAMIGAGAKGEFRHEDQLGCAWMAAGLIEAGYLPDGDQTREAIERWGDAPGRGVRRGPERGVPPANRPARRPGLRPLPRRRCRLRLRVRRRRAATGAGMNTARPVLVFRLWYHGGIGAVRSLGRLGVPVHAVHDRRPRPGGALPLPPRGPRMGLRPGFEHGVARVPSRGRAADRWFSGAARRR